MFFTYNQNNSGGEWKYAKFKHSVITIIEADNAAIADAIAKSKQDIYFNGCAAGRDCSCCGDRWYTGIDRNGCAEPTIYSKPVNDFLTKSERSYLWGSDMYKSAIANKREIDDELINKLKRYPEAVIHYANGRSVELFVTDDKQVVSRDNKPTEE